MVALPIYKVKTGLEETLEKRAKAWVKTTIKKIQITGNQMQNKQHILKNNIY